MSIGSIISKLAGIGGLCLAVKDSHATGIAGKNKNPKYQIAKTYPDMYINSQRLDMSGVFFPTVVSDLKNSFFGYFLDDSYLPFIHGITGYVKGFCTGIFNNAIPILLSAGALLMSKSGKNLPAGAKPPSFLMRNGGKACAALLALGAAKTFIYDIAGFGQPKKL